MLGSFWRYKWLLLVGLIVAVAAGYASAYRVEDGSFASRPVPSYTSTTTVLLSSPKVSPYQAATPGQILQINEVAGSTVDLARQALVFAYLASGSEMVTAVEAQVGPLTDEESISAVQRTTQPGDAEPSGSAALSRASTIPVLAITATAVTPARAQELAEATYTKLSEKVVAEQDAAALDPTLRIGLTPIGSSTKEVASGSTLLPFAVTTAAVFLAFLALALALANARTNRLAREAILAAPPAVVPGPTAVPVGRPGVAAASTPVAPAADGTPAKRPVALPPRISGPPMTVAAPTASTRPSSSVV